MPIMRSMRVLRTPLLKVRPDWQQVWPYKTYLVNERYGFVYCPIPKVACTSLKYWFANTTLTAQERIEQQALHSALKSRYALAAYSAKAARRIMDRYYKFAFFRDPIARVESGYMHKFVGTDQRTVKKLTIPVIEWVYANLRSHEVRRTESFVYQDGPGREHRMRIDPDIDYDESISFEEFVEYLCREDDEALNQHWRPQWGFLPDADFEVFDLADMDKTLPEICRRLGIEDAKVPVLNTSRTDKSGRPAAGHLASKRAGELRRMSEPIGTLYDESLRRKVAERYKSDLELLGHKVPTSGNATAGALS